MKDGGLDMFCRFYFSVYSGLSFCFDWDDISNTRDSVKGFMLSKHLDSPLDVWISQWNKFVPVTEKRFDDWLETFEILTPIMQDLVSSYRGGFIFEKDNLRSHAMFTECTKDF